MPLESEPFTTLFCLFYLQFTKKEIEYCMVALTKLVICFFLHNAISNIKKITQTSHFHVSSLHFEARNVSNTLELQRLGPLGCFTKTVQMKLWKSFN